MHAEQLLGPRRIYAGRPKDNEWKDPVTPAFAYAAALQPPETAVHSISLPKSKKGPGCTLVLCDRALYDIDEAAAREMLFASRTQARSPPLHPRPRRPRPCRPPYRPRSRALSAGGAGAREGGQAGLVLVALSGSAAEAAR